MECVDAYVKQPVDLSCGIGFLMGDRSAGEVACESEVIADDFDVVGVAEGGGVCHGDASGADVCVWVGLEDSEGGAQRGGGDAGFVALEVNDPFGIGF